MDAGGDGSGEAAVSAEPAPQAQTDTPPQPAVDPDDFDAVEPETVDSLNRKRPNMIPHPRVKAMIAKREQKLIASVAKELGITKAEAELKLEDVTGALTERKTKFSEYEAKLANIAAIEEVMAADPDRFVQLLAQTNPAYAKFAAVLQQAAAQQPQQSAVPADDPEPEPDFDLGDGRMTYSKEGMAKLRAWDRRQALREAEGKFDARLKPFEQERQRAQETARQAQIRRDAEAAVATRLEKARKRQGFTENEAEIMAAMQADPKLDLDDAYYQVVFPKLAADRTKVRQEVLTEIKATPTSTSLASAGASTATSKPKTTADIAREEIARFST